MAYEHRTDDELAESIVLAQNEYEEAQYRLHLMLDERVRRTVAALKPGEWVATTVFGAAHAFREVGKGKSIIAICGNESRVTRALTLENRYRCQRCIKMLAKKKP